MPVLLPGSSTRSTFEIIEICRCRNILVFQNKFLVLLEFRVDVLIRVCTNDWKYSPVERRIIIRPSRQKDLPARNGGSCIVAN